MATDLKTLFGGDDGGVVPARLEVEKTRLGEIAKRNGWPARLPFDLAMQIETPEETLAHYGLTPEQGARLLQTETFTKLVKAFREIIVNEGLSFKVKARLQAEELLEHAFLLATDPDVAPAVRMDSIKWHGRVAGFDTKDGDGGAGTGGGSGFSLKIVFGGPGAGAAQIVVGEERPVIDVTPEKGETK